MKSQHKKLYRSRTDRILFGVCGGLGDYFGLDPVIVRIVFVILAFINGIGVLLYLILLVVVPREPGRVTSSRRERVSNFVEEVQSTAQDVVKEVKDEVKSIKDEFKKDQKSK